MVLSPKQIRMLELLDDQVLSCTRCTLYGAGRCKPYWTISSKYAIIGEAPGKDEATYNEPFFGKAGTILWDIMQDFGLYKDQFVIVNSVNCRPTKESTYGALSNIKPTITQQQMCRKWVRKYLKVVKPQKMLVFGNSAMATLIGEQSGIRKLNSTMQKSREFGMKYVLSIHPAYCIYNEEGKDLLAHSIGIFKSLAQKKTVETYDFMEDEELWKI